MKGEESVKRYGHQKRNRKVVHIPESDRINVSG